MFRQMFEFAVGMFAALCVSKWVATGVFPLRVYDLFFILPALWKVRFSLLVLSTFTAGFYDDLAWGSFSVWLSLVLQIIFVPQVSGRSDFSVAGEISQALSRACARAAASHIF